MQTTSIAGLLPVLIFLVLALGLAIAARRRSRAAGEGGFVKEYFIGNRTLGGFVLAMTVAVSVGEGNALIIGAAGVPAVLSVSALLAACSMVWQGGEATGRYSLRTCRMPYFLCITLAVLSALLRAAIAALCDV